jgi:hypothetical protein
VSVQGCTLPFTFIEQYGFRIGLKTDNAICKQTTEILNAISNKLLVGGIFCDLEKVFDCIDQDNLLSKLKFYGISGKDHALFIIWIIDILEQQHIMTAITVIKFQAGLKLDIESHTVLFWDLCFFFYT